MKKHSVIVLIIILNMLCVHDGYGQVRKVYSTIETENVLYYKIEEIVKMTFGGTTTLYTVSDLSLISKTNLGPDNIRIITPIFKDEKYRKKYYIETENLDKGADKKHDPTIITEISIEDKRIETSGDPKVDKISLALAISNLTKTEAVPVVKNNPKKDKQPVNRVVTPKVSNVQKKVLPSPIPSLDKAESNSVFSKKGLQKTEDKKSNVNIEKPKENKTPAAIAVKSDLTKADSVVISNEPQKEKVAFVSINVIDVYERVAQKGYKSVYMFKEMANSYFFKKQMDKAVKWYEELFAMNTELEPIYYFRFGEALKKTGDTKRGEAMITRFNQMVR